nr:MAG TPA: hypothetical protein [Inoviridae sp.]
MHRKKRTPLTPLQGARGELFLLRRNLADNLLCIVF